ncbi:uncharacterized protein [Solanum lycopersicum]|uniref:uncharacterized protein n=1 Tax=Solanum lycopersicum TaxID=4081 RepID=UPI003748E691
MCGLGFPELFVNWTMKCVKTVNYSIVVNGQTSQSFDAAKGLRQGDPMSPFLFAIAMEYLSRLLKGLREDKKFKYHPRCSKLDITHLCFADDLLMFARGDLESVKAIQLCFSQFSQASGLQANLSKSSIYCGGVKKEVRNQIVQQLGYNMEELPFKYLGVPLSTKKMTMMQWYPLIEKIMARITSWTARKLSYAGRIQLVQTVLFGVQAYWAQLFLFPTKVIKLIDSMCRSYIWSGDGKVTKKALIAWERVCRPKNEGGMGLINMQLWNRAAIAKLCWDLANKEDKLWIKWIHVYYIRGLRDWQKREQASWMIRKIMQAKQIVDQVHIKEGKGMVKQIYEHIRGEQPKPVWKCLIFKNSARPKAIFTLWILMHRKLATVDRLAKWGITHDSACVLCTNKDESLDHMFLQCHYAEEVWERVLTWAGFNNNIAKTWTQFVQWCIQHGKGKTTRAQLFRMVLAEVVYAVWNERNKRIFEDKKSLVEEIVKKIAYVTIARSPISISKIISHRKI